MNTNTHGAHSAGAQAHTAGRPPVGAHAGEDHGAHVGEDHGAHVARLGDTHAGPTQPLRPAPRALLAGDAAEASRPVDGWGFSNRLMILATLLVMAFSLARVVLDPPTGSVVMGEDGRGWVASVEAILFGLVGGALAAAVGYLVVLMMGGAARSALRYVVGGVIGGLVAALLVLFIFSNTAVLSIGLHLFWLLPLAGLLAGLWSGMVAARR